MRALVCILLAALALTAPVLASAAQEELYGDLGMSAAESAAPEAARETLGDLGIMDAVEPEEDFLEELALRKYGRYLEDDADGKGRDKAIRGLMRLGHGYYDAAAAVDAAAARLMESDQPEDE